MNQYCLDAKQWRTSHQLEFNLIRPDSLALPFPT